MEEVNPKSVAGRIGGKNGGREGARKGGGEMFSYGIDEDEE